MFPLYDENRPSSKPYVNYLLITVNVAVFLFFYVQGKGVMVKAVRTLGVVPYNIFRMENLWTLLTSMFMHADVMHILGNMVYLWVFGDNIEDALGHFNYLIFYLFGGLIATFTHIASVIFMLPSVEYYWGIASLLTPSVGASGAISAVLGAYLLLYPRARIRTLVFYIFIHLVSIPAYYYLGFWFLYQLLMGMMTLTGIPSGVAFWAHIGGFAVGFISIKPFGAKVRARRPAKTREKPVEPFYLGPHVRTPFVDILVEEDTLRIIAELPGVEEKDINISVSSWDLVISAEHKDVRYYRHVVLPTMIIPKVEERSYNNGVLTFTLRRML